MKAEKAVLFIFTLIFAIVIVFPFVYALSASFFSASDFASSPARFLPSSFSFRNYQKVLANRYFLPYIMNSVITGVLSTVIRMIIAVAAAYAFSYYRFRGRSFLFSLIVLTLFVPSDLLLTGNYLTIYRLGLIDTYLGIISTSLLPASQILMLRQYFCCIPSSIHDSAMMDGAGDGRYIISVLVPVSKAVISTFALQGFIAMFNSYLWPLLVTNSPSMRTVQVGITMLGYAESLDYGPVFAAIILIFIPFLLLFIFMRKRIMKALRQGCMFI